MVKTKVPTSDLVYRGEDPGYRNLPAKPGMAKDPSLYKPLSSKSGYTVQKGDSFSSIAKRLNLPVDDLIEANLHIRNPNLVHPGQTLKLPGKAGGSAPTAFDQEISLASSRTPAKGPSATQGPTAAPPKYGAKGAYVASLQHFLGNRGYDPGPIDGDFGPQTMRALTAYRKNEGEPDWTTIFAKSAALEKTSSSSRPSTPTIGASAGSAGTAHIGGTPLTTWRGVPVGTRIQADLKAWEKAGGPPVNITDGYRTASQQAALRASKPGLAAPPGSSFHERGLAIDVDPASLGGYESSTYAKFVAFMKARGYTWGGDFSRAKEPWHFGYGE